MANISQLSPENQFPKEALEESVVVQPKPQGQILDFSGYLALSLATVADSITPWGRAVPKRDQQLRDFWPTEPFMAGAVVNVSNRNAAFDWVIKGPSERVINAVTDMLLTSIAGDQIGWSSFVQRITQDGMTQDNGWFIELIRDPGMDATSKFQGPMAPVIGIAHLDAGSCTRTGNAEYPVVYRDRKGKDHKLAWYEVIPFSDYPSSIERMNGVGYCGVTRTLRLAQIMKSIEIFKDEKIGGRHFKSIHFVSGVQRSELADAQRRGKEEADNAGQIRYIDPVILASLDPEKPVSTATIDLASLPDNFNMDTELQWYIAGLALGLGADYQDLAPLPGGNIGSASQSMILHRKSSGKGPRVWMRTITEAFRVYGVLPRGYRMNFTDKDEQEELERQEVRTTAMEEYGIAVSRGILTPAAARRSLVERGIYSEKDVEGIPEEYGEDIVQPKQTFGERGGNTIVEDNRRQDTAKPRETVADRLRKMFT